MSAQGIEGDAVDPSSGERTTRQAMIELLRLRWMSALELSGALSVPEREVYGHLVHVQSSLGGRAGRAGRKGEGKGRRERLLVEPPACAGCGFVFRKRDRLSPPSRCPLCRSERISDPLFRVDRGGRRDRREPEEARDEGPERTD